MISLVERMFARPRKAPVREGPEIKIRVVYSSRSRSRRLASAPKRRTIGWLRNPLRRELKMGHRITATENVDGTDFRLTLEKGSDDQYHEVAREPLPMGAVARLLRWAFRPVRWVFRVPLGFVWRLLGWPFRALRGQAGNAACWFERTWAATDPALDTVPSPNDPRLPTDDELRGVGLNNDAIARLREHPQGFPHTLRRFGTFDFGRVRGEGFAARLVGSAHLLLSKMRA